MGQKFLKTNGIVLLAMLACQQLMAHNGSVAYAYPLDRITVDGKLSDWPANVQHYPIARHMSDTRPVDEADFSAFFQVGYHLGDRSLYIAFTIRDNDFVEDTSANVMFNTQDGVELCLDARHLRSGSGVVSFMYSKKLRNTNHAFYDPFARKANWEIMEVAMTQGEGIRYYEWRIKLGDELIPGKSIGIDFMLFDKDTDGSFSFAGWGSGDAKFMNPNSLGDVVIMPAGQKLGTVHGKIKWDREMKEELPRYIRFVSLRNAKLWLDTRVDSLGNYSLKLPSGNYEAGFRGDYFQSGEKIFPTSGLTIAALAVKAGQEVKLPDLVIAAVPAPSLLPEKGILHDYSSADNNKIDHFIETYQKYYNIPGVSLALIREGRMVYHKVYGVKNSMSGELVDKSTLFEAASITKPVFAFAVQRLAERGVIDMDRPLYLYLPYKDIEHDDRYKLITARHVLTHRTGFPNWRYMNEDGKLNIRFTPGTAYNYSGEGFEYLKLVVEKITGKNVEQVLEEEVIGPVGLYHTFFSKNDSLQKDVANGHFNGLPSAADLPSSPGMAYSMHTEAAIFTRFAIFLLQQQGLKTETYDTMFQKHSDYNYDPGEEKPVSPAYMGMSLGIRETPYGISFGHGGNNGDFKCKFEVYKDKGMGYVIFTNSNTSDALLNAINKLLVEGDTLP